MPNPNLHGGLLVRRSFLHAHAPAPSLSEILLFWRKPLKHMVLHFGVDRNNGVGLRGGGVLSLSRSDVVCVAGWF